MNTRLFRLLAAAALIFGILSGCAGGTRGTGSASSLRSVPFNDNHDKDDDDCPHGKRC